jgi:zinc-binding alcohol dehydrogenase family protein
MKAVGYRKSLPVSDPDCLVDFELPAPSPGPRDLVVDVRAVSVNPVDFKVRLRAAPDPGATNILGFDAAGVVEAVGNAAVLFKPGDPVFYAGSIARPGSNAERQLVDERIVGHKPKVLSFAEAAALPLTAITAWELLFDRLGIVPGKRPSGHLLIIGGAGGVGSILIQLARRLTGLVVIATASRPETAQWCRDLGAHHTIDHSKPLPQELRRIGIAQVEFLASLTASERHFPEFFDLMKPQGKLALIDDPKSLDITPLKRKSISVHWELMFTRPLFETEDMIAQHHLLDDVAALVDAGVIRTTLAEHFGPITAANLRKAHALLETGTAKGKIVLEGF